jgi:hypothetical protein
MTVNALTLSGARELAQAGVVGFQYPIKSRVGGRVYDNARSSAIAGCFANEQFSANWATFSVA